MCKISKGFPCYEIGLKKTCSNVFKLGKVTLKTSFHSATNRPLIFSKHSSTRKDAAVFRILYSSPEHGSAWGFVTF